MVTVTIDNKQIEVPEGTTVLNAARMAGIEIPTLCDHPHLTPYGGCRLCMVEIDGFRTLQSSCTIPAANNMVIRTNTEKVRAARKFVLTLIFSERNHFCPYCQVSGGDCELQNSAYGEGMTHWPIQPNWQPFPVDASHPYFILEHNRCILCRRCIRACSELVGVNTLGVEERGAKTFVIADLNVPLGESTCVSCGSCIQVCPTGALIDRRSAYLGKGSEVIRHKSICTECSVGCGIEVVVRDGQILRIEGDWDSAVNGGVLCKAGRFMPLEDNRERITKPMVRKDGTLKPATWEEALEVVTTTLKPAPGVAALASTRLSAETLHLFKQIFADGLKSNMVTTLEEGKTTSAGSKVAAEIGKPFEGKLDSLDSAGSVLVLGTDLMEEHEVAGFFIRRSLAHGTSLVIIDSKENSMDAFANCTLMPAAGSTASLVKGLTAATAKLGQGKTTFAGNVDEIVAKSAEKAGISSDLVLEAAFKFSSAENPVIIFDAKTDEYILKELVGLAEICGATLINLKGGANSVAAAQYELDKSFQLNGHKVAWVALGDEVPTETLVKTLENTQKMVVLASYTSKLTAKADVVLPVAPWFEQEGHFISMDGSLQKASKVLEPVETVWQAEKVHQVVAEKLGIDIQENWKDQLVQRPASVKIVG